jgi:hypothetical protein
LVSREAVEAIDHHSVDFQERQVFYHPLEDTFPHILAAAHGFSIRANANMTGTFQPVAEAFLLVT